jgi:Ferritin-like domain
MNRAGFLRRGAVGGGALLVSASGLGTLGLPDVASADTPPPDGDLAFLRLLIAAELLAVDFQGKALKSRKLRHSAHSLLARILSDEKKHYTQLAALLTAAGQTPATADDIDFSYPKGTFRTQGSITRLAGRLEHLMVGAYLGAVESVETPALRLPIGQIAANEAQHQGALAALHGQSPVGRPFAPALQIAAVSDALDEFES